MTIEQLQEEIYRNNDKILDLQDIVFEEQIPQEERKGHFGVNWHTKEQIEDAKKRIEELESRNRELDNQINSLLATRS